jgi:hypothetical protein
MRRVVLPAAASGGAPTPLSAPIGSDGNEVVPWQAQTTATLAGDYVYFANEAGMVRVRD